MSKDYPTLEENIQVIIKDLGVERILVAMKPQEIAQAIPAKLEEALLQSLLRHARPEEIAQAVDAKQWTQIAQAISDEQKETLLRVLLEQLGTDKVESILHNDGKRRT